MKNSSLNRRLLVIITAVLLLNGCSGMRSTLSTSFRDTVSGSTIAVFPVENLSGTPAPMKAVRQRWGESVRRQGLNVLPEDVLDTFLMKHRVRFSGGITKELGRTLREETGATAALITSLDLYDDTDPPRIALTSRLVATGETSTVLWMDGTSIAGNDTPGILGIGYVHDPRELQERVVTRVTRSLGGYLRGGIAAPSRNENSGGSSVIMEGRFRPKGSFRTPGMSIAAGRPLRVAVLPFLNDSGRKNAGEIMALHFLRHLAKRNNLQVTELGEVREAFLRTRTIMEGGPSFPQIEILRDLLKVDILLYGNVRSYQDSAVFGDPFVNFSVQALDAKTGKVVWSSISFNRGNDGVFFFDWGKVNTAYAMASEMARKVVERLFDKPSPDAGSAREGMSPGT